MSREVDTTTGLRLLTPLCLGRRWRRVDTPWYYYVEGGGVRRVHTTTVDWGRQFPLLGFRTRGRRAGCRGPFRSLFVSKYLYRSLSSRVVPFPGPCSFLVSMSWPLSHSRFFSSVFSLLLFILKKRGYLLVKFLLFIFLWNQIRHHVILFFYLQLRP